ncbi:uncharacterized protein [Rutidosis leptorrhynchoides]|uniref:uncharacterized protein n=1 Tax=Rutidosis leptorrhynchoides TaxID=125765 RepID=UPI003A9A4BE7
MFDLIKQRGVEVKEALSILKKSHGLTLCQVWIPHFVKNGEEVVVKFWGYYKPAFKAYYNACVKIQDGSGGLAVKALETFQAYFSRNFIKGELQALIPATSASESSCCVVICLRNIYTGDVDYAFEFIFSSSLYDNNNPCVFLESLFSKLETCLPSFYFSSGAKLGRELLILDVDNPTASFNIFATKKQEVDSNGSLLRISMNMNWAAVEIKEAISFLTVSHGLTLCQVWMYSYYNNEKGVVKFVVNCAAAYKDYYDACVKIQDGAGELAAKTLLTRLPYFSRNINNIIKGELLHSLPPAATSASESTCCLAICLRNVYTADILYAFEFFFTLHDNNNKDLSVFLESLLITLEKCLPNFKLPNGAQLGPHLQVLDGDNLNVNFDLIAFIKQQEEDDDCMKGTDEAAYTNDDIGGHIRATMDVSASLKFADLKTKISQMFDLDSNAYWILYLLEGSKSNGGLWMELVDVVNLV